MALAELLALSEEEAAPFPARLGPNALVDADGVARLLVLCSAPVRGRLVVRTLRRERPGRVVGRAAFVCEPDSEIAEVRLDAPARERLERDGRLRVEVRLHAQGRSRAGRVLLRASPERGR